MVTSGGVEHPQGDVAGSGAPDPCLTATDRLLARLGHAVITTDLAGRIAYWNPAAEELYGWTAGEVVGRYIQDVTVPRMTQEMGAEIMQVVREGGQWSGGFTVQRKDGTTFPALVTDAGVRGDDGALVGIVGVSTDLGHALKPLLTHSSDAALVLTREASVAYVSPATHALFGWDDAAVLGTPLWELVHPEDRPGGIDRYGRVLHSTESIPPWECRLSRPDGSWRWVEILMTRLLGDPAVRGVVCNLRDVTERRADRDRLVELTEQLQTALSSRVVIEQAKGMLAAMRGIGPEEAFELLRRHARHHNARLRDVADAVVTLGLRL